MGMKWGYMGMLGSGESSLSASSLFLASSLYLRQQVGGRISFSPPSLKPPRLTPPSPTPSR
jgi:hypothetical protein